MARRRRRPSGRRHPSVASESPVIEPEADAAEETGQELVLAPHPHAKTGDGAFPVEVAVTVPRGWARKINAKLIRSVVERALETEGWKEPGTLEVLMLRDEEIREVNATRRGIDEGTDVLSFPMMQLKPGAEVTEEFFVLPPESRPHLGDVLLSVDRIEVQAKEAGHSTERELAYLTVHGVLHILGYDHEIERDRRAMRTREEDVLASLGLRRAAES